MERRTFLTSLLGTAALSSVIADDAHGQTPSPEFYVWRQYVLRNGTEMRRVADFLQNAAIPALNRLGHKPIGVFEVVAGVPTPTLFTLTPVPSLDRLATLDSSLEADEQFMKTGAAYIDAPATDMPYVRQEVSLLAAFPKMPHLEVPGATATKGPRDAAFSGTPRGATLPAART